MAATRRRNHNIPRFLLNRFACRREGDKRWIWQISRRGAPKEISTRDAAVSRDFYGGHKTGLENALSDIETPLHNVLVAIDSGSPLESHAQELRQLVWSLALRTAALRGQFEQTATNMLDILVEAATDEKLRSGVMDHFEKNLDELVLEQMPPDQRDRVAIVLQNPAIRMAVQQAVRVRIERESFKPLLVGLSHLLRSQGTLEKAARGGHIKALNSLLREGRSPEWFAPMGWQKIDMAPHSVILGDCCVVGISSDGAIGPLLGRSEDWQLAFVPISHSSVLVAHRTTGRALLTAAEVNKASAMCSLEHLYASSLPDDLDALLNIIGSSPMFDNALFDELRRNGW